MEGECRGIVLKADRAARRICALTPEGLWHFFHPIPSAGRTARAPKVLAAALNPLCHSHFVYTARERGWGWLRQAHLVEILWPSESQDQGELLARLEAGAHLRHLVLLSQQPAGDCPKLFQLLMSSLRQLMREEKWPTVLAVFAVKLLIHEGQWPQPLQCAHCELAIGDEAVIMSIVGISCERCWPRQAKADGEVRFSKEQVTLLQGVGLHREWAALRALDIDGELAQKIALAAQQLLHLGK